LETVRSLQSVATIRCRPRLTPGFNGKDRTALESMPAPRLPEPIRPLTGVNSLKLNCQEFADELGEWQPKSWSGLDLCEAALEATAREWTKQ
jgi:hypothetical protein